MPAKRFELLFNGYWREPNIPGIPPESGVFCAYVCTFNATEKTVALVALLFIGHSENAKTAVADHPLWPEWRAQKVEPNHQICFNFAPVETADRDRVAGAMVFFTKPSTNHEGRETFPFNETMVSVSGRAHLLPPTMTVHRKK